MISGNTYFLIKPGALYKVRATCSFAPSEDCIDEQGHIYADKGIIHLEKNTVLMLVEAKFKFCDWNQLRGQQMVVFKFISDSKAVFLPVTAVYKNEDEFNDLIKTYLELYLQNIDKSVERTSV